MTQMSPSPPPIARSPSSPASCSSGSGAPRTPRQPTALGSVGLTPALFAVLNYLRANERAIQQQIGSSMGIDPSTMVSLIDQLERAGLAKRRPSSTDRRAREVAITPKGRRLLNGLGG